MAPVDFLPGAVLSRFVNEARSAMPSTADHTEEPRRLLSIMPRDLVRAATNKLTEVTRRDTDKSDDSTERIINLTLVVLGLVFLGLILVSVLFFFRRRRLQQRKLNGGLPSYDDASQCEKQQALTIETTHKGRSSVFFISRDGQPMLQNPGSPPHSPDNVPQIHITFPDEPDEMGRTQSGRVLVVRVGDNAAVGLEPMQEEQLPAYEKDAKGQFQSIDMNHIGGLKEKDRTVFQ